MVFTMATFLISRQKTYTCTPYSLVSLHVIAYMVALRTHLAGFTPGRVVTGLGITDEAAAIAAESVT